MTEIKFQGRILTIGESVGITIPKRIILENQLRKGDTLIISITEIIKQKKLTAR